MSNTQKIILVVGLIILAVVLYLIFKGGKTSKHIIPVSPYPSYCNPNKPGYNNLGYPDYACGTAAPDYSADCDPYKPGYDVNGFPNANCGFGRVGNKM